MLAVEHVVKTFGGATALAGVGLSVQRGEVLGLIGPNGSGKTTLVNCLSGVLAMNEGEIHLDGRRLTRASRRQRARAGLIRTYQNPRLFGGLTVRENITVGLNALGRRAAKSGQTVDAMLDRFQIRDLARRVVSDLPYGYQRRVEIARALVAAPNVLLLDEPAAGLNDNETAALRDLLGEIRGEGDCGIVVIDHDMGLILGVSDRLLVLDEGREIFMGAPEQAFRERQVVEAYLGTG